MPSPLEYAGKAWMNASGFKSREIETSVGRLHFFEAGHTRAPSRPWSPFMGWALGRCPLVLS